MIYPDPDPDPDPEARSPKPEARLDQPDPVGAIIKRCIKHYEPSIVCASVTIALVFGLPLFTIKV